MGVKREPASNSDAIINVITNCNYHTPDNRKILNHTAMKKILLPVFTFLTVSFMMAQSPAGFSYQAVARNGSGTPMANTTLTIQLSVIQGAPGGTEIWSEEHGVTTSPLGLFTVIVGSGGTRTGGTVAEFSEIDWSEGPYYLQTQVDPGTGLVDLGTTQIGTVPHALSANNLSSPLTGLEVVGNPDPTDTVLFEVKRNDGTPVFAVYDHGVRVFVDETETKGLKGGFAVGGYNRNKGTISQDYLWVTRDSTRIYVPTDEGAKGLKGGFAVGGYGKGTKSHHLPGEGGYQVEYLMGINRDITRFNASDLTEGFAIGNPADEWGSNFLRLTRFNYFIGLDAGRNIIPGTVGDGGKFNAYLGFQAGARDIKGRYNLFMGHMAGWNNMGHPTQDSGNYNVFVGHKSGFKNSSGFRNLFVGHGSGYDNVSGYENIFVGNAAGTNNQTGYGNVYIGRQAGHSNTQGDLNVFLGFGAGAQETGSGYLYIDNSGTTDPLIFGDFFEDYATVNGDLYVSGTLYELSDMQKKTNIRPLGGSLEKVKSLNGVSFDWEKGDTGKGRLRSPAGSIGVIAQDVEAVFPELVSQGRSGEKAVNYTGLIPVLLEAIKEQQQQIDLLKEEILLLRQQ